MNRGASWDTIRSSSGAALWAKPNEEMEAASSVKEKEKMADGSGFPSPLPCVVAKRLSF